ncbi:acyl-CoA dehydrogenase family protein [Solwaraspora sp. WMMA2080]|uniref:acyl-CoA dehydrogenase family protein n=1 Tax=unclassified Solwaraspora TaxID=2627926 RepID=UPI00248CE14D|nr:MULTISPECIES: acyl-CoA dehydrogenase family protein [unclassified Solwaraspora]WBB98907.1 acyl-CoA dehydrogenase family protein [Solwaraspora sp. WMMA2059]WBC22540.1 acyl-CoA dehydrogenase family protein [Solwaraspora sp. WMMA2080]
MHVLQPQVAEFVRSQVIPAEAALAAGGEQGRAALGALQQRARAAALWAIPLPVALGGQGLGLTDYAGIAEAEGYSDYGPVALGSDSLLDATMLDTYATAAVRDRYLGPMVAGRCPPSFAMTEPQVPGTDPAALRTSAVRDGDDWVITGRKWFTSRAADAGFTTVVCRTGPGSADDDPTGRSSLSLLLVPTTAPGYRIVRQLPVLGAGGQYEIALDGVRVPGDHLIGAAGAGLRIVAGRLSLGRTLRCLRWLGQTARAFDLMCRRLTGRQVGTAVLADKQLLHGYVFDSHAELAAARALTRAAVAALAAGGDARTATGTAKVVAARAFHAVVDRAVQVYGAEGLTDDTPLAMLLRAARAARILDGPDELHVTTVATRLLADYQATNGGVADCAASAAARK